MPGLYGLIGFPLKHSFSPSYFKDKFTREGIDASYQAFELEDLSELPKLIKDNPSLKGLNVTIPYKKRVLPYLDELDEIASEIGAVNCVDIRGGMLKGYNTDAFGFEQSLRPFLKSQHTKALVLGTGGASLAVKYVLKKLGIEYSLVSSENKGDALLYSQVSDEVMAECKLIMNTTPLGMYPAAEGFPPIPYKYVTEDHLLYDLVYNPEETVFLSKGRAKGAVVKNGLEMLQWQAEESWRIWQISVP